MEADKRSIPQLIKLTQSLSNPVVVGLGSRSSQTRAASQLLRAGLGFQSIFPLPRPGAVVCNACPGVHFKGSGRYCVTDEFGD